MKGGIIKNAYPLNIDKPRGYQLNSADNKKVLESKIGLYSFRSKQYIWSKEQMLKYL